MTANQEKDNAGLEGSFQTVIIGGGQAGLAAGYYLIHEDENFIILDQNHRTGDSWRHRWDSLRLFTPSRFNNLPGMKMPKPGEYFPTKDEVAEYLEAYSHQFNLPIKHNITVQALDRDSQGYQVFTNQGRLSARNVIIATGPFQKPYIPTLSGAFSPDIMQIHSSVYKNPQQISGKSVLVVGAGNSGAEIAVELAKAGKQVWLAGRDVGRIPVNSPFGKLFGGRLFWWFMTHLITVDTPIGRKMHTKTIHQGTGLGRLQRKTIAEEGVILAPRLEKIQTGMPVLADGRTLQVEAVIWASGFQPDYDWIHLPIFDDRGYPLHSHGKVQNEQGLYFLGLLFQIGLSSSLLGGVGIDAAYIAKQVSKNRSLIL